MLKKFQQLIQSKTEYMSIRQKLEAGFKTILGFMLVVVLVTMIGLLIIRSDIDSIVEVHQPSLTTSIELWERIYRASNALGFYLVSQETVHKTEYETTINMVDQSLNELKSHLTHQGEDEGIELIKSIESDINHFKKYQSHLFELAGNDQKNIPALTFSATNLNPHSQNILSNISLMLQSEATESASKRRKEILLAITSLRYSWTNVMNHTRGYLAFRDNNTLTELEAHKENSLSAIKQIQKFSDDDSIAKLTFEQEDALEAIIRSREIFFNNIKELIKIHSGDEWRQDAFLIRTEIGPLLRTLNEKLGRLETLQRIKIDSANDYLIAQVVFIILLGIAMLIAAIFAATTISRRLVASIADPLRAAVEATGRIASGDLTVKLEETSEDEIGQLITSLNMMSINLCELIGKVQTSGIQVTSSSTEIAATAKQQEATISEQAATANQISTTATEISATTQELVETMDEVTHIAETTAASAANSQSALGSMEQTMHHMMDATGNISAKLSVLSEKAANINSVVTTITKVADQTNLLSLNAAIEAEKAGEYGIGFSVVATEIRRLADQTAVATWDIEQMVKEMQSAVSTGVMGMDKFSEEVRNGVNEVRHVGTQLADIIEQVQNLLPSFSAVHEGMQNQALSAQQITESINQLSEGTQQTADSVRQSSGAITQLHTAARALQDGVSRFKVKSGV